MLKEAHGFSRREYHEINEQMEKGHFEISPVDPKSKLTITWGNLKVQQR